MGSEMIGILLSDSMHYTIAVSLEMSDEPDFYLSYSFSSANSDLFNESGKNLGNVTAVSGESVPNGSFSITTSKTGTDISVGASGYALNAGGKLKVTLTISINGKVLKEMDYKVDHSTVGKMYLFSSLPGTEDLN